MRKIKLNNGIVLLTKRRPSSNTIALNVTVNIGGNNENEKLKGISHFVEHMVFNGTKNRTTQEIANEIESIGGEINAMTTNEKTSFFCIVPSKYFDRALSILSDIIQNPLFEEKSVEKERKVILDEINMYRDDPKLYQWILLQRTLFKRHPVRMPIAGTKETMKAIKRADLVRYHNKYYHPGNITVAVVGNFNNVNGKIERAFKRRKGEKAKRKKVKEGMLWKNLGVIQKRKTQQSYFLLGYKAANRKSRESYVFDMIKAILGRGQSSKLFTEIRVNRGIGYLVGANYEAGIDYGYFGIFVGTDRKNIGKVREVVLREIKNLENVGKKELEDAKTFIEGNYLLENEDNFKCSDYMTSWQQLGGDLERKYLANIKKVSRKDIARAVRKYMKFYGLVLIEQA